MARKLGTPKRRVETGVTVSNSTNNGLEELYPQGIDILLKDGRQLNVQAFDFDELAEAARYVVDFGVALDSIDLTDPAVILGLLTRNTEPMYRLVALFVRRYLKEHFEGFATDDDVYKYVRQLKGIDGVKIAAAGAKMNYDFFGQAREFVGTLFPTLSLVKPQESISATEPPMTGSLSSPSSEDAGQDAKSTG